MLRARCSFIGTRNSLNLHPPALGTGFGRSRLKTPDTGCISGINIHVFLPAPGELLPMDKHDITEEHLLRSKRNSSS
jgi:hypothetical protein